MSTSPFRRVAVVALVPILVLAACGGGGGGKATTRTTAAGATSLAKECPLGAIAKASSKPVRITLWHSMPRANEQTLQKLADEFNASQSDVIVRLVNQTSYDDTLTKYKAALGGGELPDLVQIQDVDQQLMIDSQSVLPAQACVDAEKVDLSDFLPRVLRYYTVKSVLWPMPFNTSNPVLYYDKNVFRKAGLDPDKPPTTLDELRTAAQKIVSSGAARFGLALKLDPWYLEEWTAMAGEAYVDHGNGREGRAGKVVFDGSAGQNVFSWLSAMARDKLAEGVPQAGFDGLLAVANGVAGMTLETSAALGTIVQVLASGQFKNVQLGIGALPGPQGSGGTVVAGAALYLVKKSPPERQEAAWRFARFLAEPAQQATWAVGTGYVPIRKSAAALPAITKLWADDPGFKIAYDQLQRGTENVASAGPVIGDFEAVRRAVVKAEEGMFQRGLAPDVALRQAADEANRAIADYEARVGG